VAEKSFRSSTADAMARILRASVNQHVTHLGIPNESEAKTVGIIHEDQTGGYWAEVPDLPG
jgi:hypothetical protein